MDNNKFYSGLDAVYLVTCAINQKTPDRLALEKIDYGILAPQIKRHSLQAMAYLAFKSYYDAHGELLASLPIETFNDWEKVYKRTIRSTVAYAMEREKIFAFFEQKGIWYLPLKGIYLQNFYPVIGMRQMSDNDILFDSSYCKELKEYMVSIGYTVQSYGKHTHDVYQKAPFFNFEMHLCLYKQSTSDVFAGYYQNVKDRLVKDEGNGYGYHFTDEDFYIHTLTHINKHYVRGGLGIRFLSDIYVFLINKENSLDWDYLTTELSKLELVEFELKLRSLSKKLFTSDAPYLRDDIGYLTDAEQTELRFFVDSGIYGTKEQAVKSELKKLSGNNDIGIKNKARYVINRIFPKMIYYKEAYPFLYKYKVFIPFFVVYRLFKGLVLKGRQTLKELRRLK